MTDNDHYHALLIANDRVADALIELAEYLRKVESEIAEGRSGYVPFPFKEVAE